MKKKVHNPKRMMLVLFALVLAGATLHSQDAAKEITQAYDVSPGITLSSDTKYSDIELLTWDQDVVDIRVEIEVDAASKNAAEDRLEKIDVEISRSGNTIELETEFDDGWSRNSKVSIRITAKVPAYLNLDMESSYGDLFIQELDGFVLLELKYGNLKAGTLSRGNEKPYNMLELAYSDGTIESAGWLEVELAYSDLEVGTSTMIFSENKYSKLLGESVEGIVTEGAYDKYYFDRVGSFVGELRYSGIKFGSLESKLNLEGRYTNVNIESVARDFKEIKASVAYGNINLGIDDGASFKVEAESRYGKVVVDKDGKLNKTKDKSEMKVWGTVGSSPKALVQIETAYGNAHIH